MSESELARLRAEIAETRHRRMGAERAALVSSTLLLALDSVEADADLGLSPTTTPLRARVDAAIESLHADWVDVDAIRSNVARMSANGAFGGDDELLSPAGHRLRAALAAEAEARPMWRARLKHAGLDALTVPEPVQTVLAEHPHRGKMGELFDLFDTLPRRADSRVGPVHGGHDQAGAARKGPGRGPR